jgi:hypothetical protein
MFCSASEHPEWLPPLPIFQACAAGATVIHVNTADAGLRAPKEFMFIGKATACSVLRGGNTLKACEIPVWMRSALRVPLLASP